MKAPVVTFYSRPREVSLSRETRIIPSIDPRWTSEELIPYKQGGGRFAATYDGCYSIDLGFVFVELGVLWQINGFAVGIDHVKIEARSVASLEDLVELIPVP